MITYKVEEFFTTLNSEQKNLTINTVFESEDLLMAKKLAESFYLEKCNKIENTVYLGLPYANPDNFIMGENSANSVDLLVVVDEREYSLSDVSLDGYEGYEIEAEYLHLPFEFDELTDEVENLWKKRYATIIVDNLDKEKEDYLNLLKNK